MMEFERRVVEEKAALDVRLDGLREFIAHSIVFTSLPAAEKVRLGHQARIMGEYSDILAERIAAFTEVH